MYIDRRISMGLAVRHLLEPQGGVESGQSLAKHCVVPSQLNLAWASIWLGSAVLALGCFWMDHSQQEPAAEEPVVTLIGVNCNFKFKQTLGISV